jgi:hypothetical protein
VIHRLNGFFPAGTLRDVEAVLADLQPPPAAAFPSVD